MKKSELYRMAQVAVLDYSSMNLYRKLDVLRELMKQEDMERMIEKHKEENAE